MIKNDLISREDLRKELKNVYSETGFCKKSDCNKIIMNMPKAIDIEKLKSEIMQIHIIANTIGDYCGVTQQKWDILSHTHNLLDLLDEINKE